MMWVKTQRKKFLRNIKSYSLTGVYVWGRELVERKSRF